MAAIFTQGVYGYRQLQVSELHAIIELAVDARDALNELLVRKTVEPREARLSLADSLCFNKIVALANEIAPYGLVAPFYSPESKPKTQKLLPFALVSEMTKLGEATSHLLREIFPDARLATHEGKLVPIAGRLIVPTKWPQVFLNAIDGFVRGVYFFSRSIRNAADNADDALREIDACIPLGWEGPSPDRPLRSIQDVEGWLNGEVFKINALAELSGRGAFTCECANTALRNAFLSLHHLRLQPPIPEPEESTLDPYVAEARLRNLYVAIQRMGQAPPKPPQAADDARQAERTTQAAGEVQLGIQKKRSTQKGDAAIKLKSAFLAWHKYDSANCGSCANFVPIEANELARKAGILRRDSRSGSASASRFFDKWFGDDDDGGHARYMAICAERDRQHILIAQCRIMAGDPIPARMMTAGSDPTQPELDDD